MPLSPEPVLGAVVPPSPEPLWEGSPPAAPSVVLPPAAVPPGAGLGAGAGVVPLPVVIAIVVIALSYYLFNKTRYGRYTVSIGSNEDAARLVGIRTDLIKILTYIYSGILCALAGIILCARSEAAVPDAGNAYEMDAIAACVIGGTSMSGGHGSIIGTMFGAILMSTITNGLSMLNVNTFWHQVVIGLFIIAAVSFDGFTSAKRKEK